MATVRISSTLIVVIMFTLLSDVSRHVWVVAGARVCCVFCPQATGRRQATGKQSEPLKAYRIYIIGFLDRYHRRRGKTQSPILGSSCLNPLWRPQYQKPILRPLNEPGPRRKHALYALGYVCTALVVLSVKKEHFSWGSPNPFLQSLVLRSLL